MNILSGILPELLTEFYKMRGRSNEVISIFGQIRNHLWILPYKLPVRSPEVTLGREKWDRGRGRFFSGFPFFFPQPSSDREDSSNFAVGRLILNAEDGSTESDVDRANGNGVVNGFASGGVNWHFVDFTAADASRHSSNGSEK